jgi:hypothetical protein
MNFFQSIRRKIWKITESDNSLDAIVALQLIHLQITVYLATISPVDSELRRREMDSLMTFLQKVTNKMILNLSNDDLPNEEEF